MKRHENGGRPIIYLENLKYKQGSEILLKHQFDQMPLDVEYVKSTLKMLYKIANRPVNIKTVDVEVEQSTSYNPMGRNQYFVTSYKTKNETKYVYQPCIYKFDGARFTRVKDTKTEWDYEKYCD